MDEQTKRAEGSVTSEADDFGRRLSALQRFAYLRDVLISFCEEVEPEIEAIWPEGLPRGDALLDAVRGWQDEVVRALGMQPRDQDLVKAMQAAGFYWDYRLHEAPQIRLWGWYRDDLDQPRVACVVRTFEDNVWRGHELTLSSPCRVHVADESCGMHVMAFPSVQAFLEGALTGVTGRHDTSWAPEPEIVSDGDGGLRCPACGFAWRRGAPAPIAGTARPRPEDFA
jgi:hypothetical protein